MTGCAHPRRTQESYTTIHTKREWDADQKKMVDKQYTVTTTLDKCADCGVVLGYRAS